MKHWQEGNQLFSVYSYVTVNKLFLPLLVCVCVKPLLFPWYKMKWTHIVDNALCVCFSVPLSPPQNCTSLCCFPPSHFRSVGLQIGVWTESLGSLTYSRILRTWKTTACSSVLESIIILPCVLMSTGFY